MTYTADELNRLMAAPCEHERLEFKEARQQLHMEDLFRYCVALGNEGGGKLLLGITDKAPRKVVGTRAYENLDKVKSKIFDKLHFRVEVEEVSHPDGRVLVFTVPPRPAGTAFSYEGAYLMRVGESLHPMTEDRLRRIFEEGKPDFLLRPALTNVSEEDVVRLLDTQGFFELMQLPYPATREATLARLAQEQLTVKSAGTWNITNLGALLFARDLGQFGALRRKAPRVIVYKGTSKLETVREQMGVKGYAVGFKELVGYINSQLPANEVIGQALRTETRMYPEIAIRELVANALVHQDLEDFGSFVMIEIYCDRIEVTNPGKPLIHPDRFIDEYKSRNEHLTDLMRRFSICEEKSSGIDKVVGLAETWQLPAPDFRKSEHHTSVVLFAHKPFEKMDSKERVRACYQHACLRYVSNEKMTNQSLRERFQLPEHKTDAISRIITDAVEAGRIRIDNPDNRSRRYAKYVPYWG